MAEAAPQLHGGRVIWAGRFSDRFEGLDEWCCHPKQLATLLPRASELVVLDALSFPWGRVSAHLSWLPVVVSLPEGFSAKDIDDMLGAQITPWLSPHDRLLHSNPDVRQELSERWDVAADSWSVPSAPDVAAHVEFLTCQSASMLETVLSEVGTFHAEAGDLITRHLIDYGRHQAGTLNVLLGLLSPGECVLDAGAHIGTFSIPIARAVGARGRVCAVEADTINYELLRRNVHLNGVGDRVVVVNAVLGSPGRTSIPEYHVGNSGNTLFETSFIPGSVSESSLDIALRHCHSVGSFDLVKVDLEGADVDALSASTEVMSTLPTIISEVSGSLLARRGRTKADLDAFLRARGYVMFPISGPRNFRGKTAEVARVESLEEWHEDSFDMAAAQPTSPHFERLLDMTNA